MTQPGEPSAASRSGSSAPWRPLAEDPGHPIAPLHGAHVGEGVRLSVEAGPRDKVGASYFRAFLDSDDLGRTVEPVIVGLINRGPYPGFNWVEVVSYRDRLTLDDGRSVEVPEGIDVRTVRALCDLVPPGGHLMMEYESTARRLTAEALAARVPPVATPLGAMMFAGGCGVAFRDWYISEGGREGPRKLQGFRALDEDHERRRGEEMLRELESFMPRSSQLVWRVQAATRPLAEAAIAVLRHRLRDTPSEAGREDSETIGLDGNAELRTDGG